MTFRTASFVDHVAFFVKDIHWHTAFFEEVFGLTVREVRKDGDELKQVFLNGGIQLIADSGFTGPEGRMGHLGFMVENREEVLEKAYARGVTELSKGRHWFSLPDGLCIEVLEAANPGAIEAYGKVEVR
jgi:catechol 2,3-dioxygenase-like lactoylglutathione lyase family enzyme